MLGFLGLVPIRDWLYIGVIVACLGSVVYFHHKWYDQGHADAITEINAANQKASDDALKAQKDVDACYAAGGDWNRTTGVCDHPSK